MISNILFSIKSEMLGLVLYWSNLWQDEEWMAENASQHAGNELFHAWNRATDTSDEAFHTKNDLLDTRNVTLHASDKPSYAWNGTSEA